MVNCDLYLHPVTKSLWGQMLINITQTGVCDDDNKTVGHNQPQGTSFYDSPETVLILWR